MSPNRSIRFPFLAVVFTIAAASSIKGTGSAPSCDCTSSHVGAGDEVAYSQNSPRWSPIRDEIAYVREQNGVDGRSWSIVVLNIKSGASKSIASLSDAVGEIDWSPDGKRLVISRMRNGCSELWLVTVANGNTTPVTRARLNDGAPAWSPDGNWIAFSGFSDRSGQGIDIKLVKPDGTREHSITALGSFASNPSWAPDSKSLVFDSDHEDVQGLYTVRIADKAVKKVYRSDRSAAMPSWSPDGKRIAFVSSRDAFLGIYACKADGTGVTPLYESRDRIGQPLHWNRDGKRLAFVKKVGERNRIFILDLRTRAAKPLLGPDDAVQNGKGPTRPAKKK